MYNVHSLLHLCDDVQKYKCLDNISAFPFENYLQTLKRMVRKKSDIVTQVARRISEKQVKCKTSRSPLKDVKCAQPNNAYLIGRDMPVEVIRRRSVIFGYSCKLRSSKALSSFKNNVSNILGTCRKPGNSKVPRNYKNNVSKILSIMQEARKQQSPEQLQQQRLKNAQHMYAENQETTKSSPTRSMCQTCIYAIHAPVQKTALPSNLKQPREQEPSNRNHSSTITCMS